MLALRQAGVLGLGCVIAWSPLAAATTRAWALAISQLLVLLTAVCWALAMAGARRLEWRRTALDLPVFLLLVLVLLQIGLGGRPLVRWALEPVVGGGVIDLPVPFRMLGTVSAFETWRSLGWFLTYAAVYVLTVNLMRHESDLRWMIRGVVLFGGTLALVGLVEYLTGESWLLVPRERPRLARLAGPFINPDHFASWLAMASLLGLGVVRFGRHAGGPPGALARVLTIRVAREDLVRRYLPAIGIGVMLLALVFTLSRGALVGLIGALLFVLVLFGALGHARWLFTVVAGVLVVVLGYAWWIGLAPLVARFAEGQNRWTQLVSSVPILLDFPTLGVGLGAYKDIYFRYQPAALGPGKVYFPYAHNDLVQLVLELGPLGGVLLLFAIWRVAGDLIFAHLLGRGRCPVGGGEGEWAQRHDPFSTGIAVGTLGAVMSLLIHSAFDFSARIPAVGILGAASLGIATVALHTRFDGRSHLLTAVYRGSLGPRRVPCWLFGITAILLAGIVAILIVRSALVEAQLDVAMSEITPERVERALRLDPAHPRANALRGVQRLAAARRIWSLGLDASGRTVDPGRRRQEAEILALGSIADLQAAITVTPSLPFLHEQLGWAYGVLADVDTEGADDHWPRAVVHFRRAIVLAPHNPSFHRALAIFALTRPAVLLPIGLESARVALRYDPGLLPDFVHRLSVIGLTGARWLELTPDSWIDRLQLGSLLEARGRLLEAGIAYRDAVGRAPASDGVGLWLLARLLIEAGEGPAALMEADRALARDPGNPELQLVRAQALAAADDPAALDAYRAAAHRADAMAGALAAEVQPFKPVASVASGISETEMTRLRALIVERVGQRVTPLRYHRLLGRYLIDRRLWEQAGAEWDMVLDELPTDAEAHRFRGQVWEALGHRDRALARYRQAVILDARPAIRLPLARLLWATEQYYQAMNEWRAVLETDPRNVEALLGLAQAHLKEGNRVAAYHRFQRVLQITPDNAAARREVDRLTGKLK